MIALLFQWIIRAVRSLQGILGIMRVATGPVAPVLTASREDAGSASQPDGSSEPGAVGNAWTFLVQAFEQYNDRPFEVAAGSWPPKDDVFETEEAGVHAASVAHDETYETGRI